MSLSTRLKKAVEESGVQRQADFAAEVGIPLERLKNMLNDRVHAIRVEEAEAIQRKFGWRDVWLRTGKGPERLTKDEQAVLSGEDAPAPALKMASKLVQELGIRDDAERDLVQRVFVAATRPSAQRDVQLNAAFVTWHGVRQTRGLGDGEYVQVPRHAVTASAGHGALIHDESIIDHLAFRRDWLCQFLGVDPAHVALIDARGDSMSPTIDSGDLLLLDTRAAEHRAEGIYVITLEGALLVKRIKFKLSGAVEVASDNPRYPPESLTRKAAAELAVVGRVVWHGRKV